MKIQPSDFALSLFSFIQLKLAHDTRPQTVHKIAARYSDTGKNAKHNTLFYQMQFYILKTIKKYIYK